MTETETVDAERDYMTTNLRVPKALRERIVALGKTRRRSWKDELLVLVEERLDEIAGKSA